MSYRSLNTEHNVCWVLVATTMLYKNLYIKGYKEGEKIIDLMKFNSLMLLQNSWHIVKNVNSAFLLFIVLLTVHCLRVLPCKSN